MADTIPLIWGHRGSPLRTPENTIESFLQAEAEGADGVEFDVRLSADGHAAVIHDAELLRTTGREGKVGSFDLRTLRSMDAANGFPGPGDERRKLPGLENVLGAIGRGTLVNIEMKISSSDPVRVVLNLAKSVADSLKRHGRIGSAIVSCFDPRALDAVKAEDSRISVGWLLSPRLPWSRKFAGRPAVFECLHPHHSLVNPILVARCRKRGIRINSWTVDHPLHAALLSAMGVDGIITNQPSSMRAVIGAAQVQRQEVIAS